MFSNQLSKSGYLLCQGEGAAASDTVSGRCASKLTIFATSHLFSKSIAQTEAIRTHFVCVTKLMPHHLPDNELCTKSGFLPAVN